MRTVHEATVGDLRERVKFLTIQANIWRDIAAITCFDPIKGQNLIRNACFSLLPYSGSKDPLTELMDYHYKLLKEAGKAGLTTGIFDFDNGRPRPKNSDKIWAKKLSACVAELEKKKRC